MTKRPSYTAPGTIRYRLRRKRFETIEKIIRRYLKDGSVVSILDVGGRSRYWDLMSDELRSCVKITILNLENDHEQNMAGSRIEFQHVVGNGCSMPEYADGQFDLVHSNSVIEHVGSLSNMARYAAETRRVGKSYYVQTPYLGFPIEPHFGLPLLHWLPASTRAQIRHRLRIGYGPRLTDYVEALKEADSTNIVDKYLMKNLFPDASIIHERYMLFTKSLILFRH